MTIDTSQVLSITEANQNFSRATRIVDKQGSAVIFKNNKPKYVLVSWEDSQALALTDDEKIDVVARRIMNKHRKAFEELAK